MAQKPKQQQQQQICSFSVCNACKDSSSCLSCCCVSAAGSVQEGGALPLPGRDLVPAGQEGEGAPGSHHQSHRGPVQLRHQLCHHHLPQQPHAEGQPKGQAAGALDRRGAGERQQQQQQLQAAEQSVGVVSKRNK